MARIIHRVFVSSTFEDLREERAEVQKALLKLGCFPVGMELFPSADDETWEFIKRQIDESDYYIVIVAGKYGSIASDGLSFTQKEWLYARETQKPSIAFLHAEPGSIIADKTEGDADKRDKLAAFQADLKKSPVCTFRNSHELAAQVTYSLVDLKERHPRPGFVHAEETADLRKYAELLEENSSLKKQLAATEQVTLFRGSSIELEVTVIPREFVDAPTGGHYEDRAPQSKNFLYADIFIAVADGLLRGQILPQHLTNHLARALFGYSGKVEKINDIMSQLFAFGLVTYQQETVNSQHFGPSVRTLWMLNEVGQTQYGLLKQRNVQKEVP